MKINKFVIILFAVAAVAIIAMIWGNRQRQAQQPVDAQKAEKVPKTADSLQKQTEKRPAEPQPSTELAVSSRLPAAIENKEPIDSLAEDSAYQPLKALETVAFEPDWDEAANHPQLDNSLLSDEQSEQIQHSPVPMLLPEVPKLLQAARISTGSGWYAAAMKEDDVTVTVSGNAKVALVPDTPAAEPPELGTHETSITRVEGIVEISFKAFGIYYDVTVECYDHQTDPRCTEDGYALELVDALRLAQ